MRRIVEPNSLSDINNLHRGLREQFGRDFKSDFGINNIADRASAYKSGLNTTLFYSADTTSCINAYVQTRAHPQKTAML